MATLNIALENYTTSSNVYAHITGQAIQKNNAVFLLGADGKTPYYPASPSSAQTALSADVNIKLGPPGSKRLVTIPLIAGGRIWFSIDQPLTFLLNPGPGLVEPSVSNPADPNFNKNWGFCEFTFNQYQLYANISYVDFVSLPIALTLTNAAGATQHVTGMPSYGLDVVCANLRKQNAIDQSGWDKLIVQANGRNLRALSPNTAAAMNPALFEKYFDSYVNSCWAKFANAATPLRIDTQAQWGVVTGRTINDRLTFDGIGSYAKPSTRDIFSCSTGPFADVAGQNATAMGALTARLAAALNRSVLLNDGVHPTDEKVALYYKRPPTNHYSRIVHEANTDRRGYAFPYDDVAAAGNVDQSGSVFDGSPKLFTVTLGGGGNAVNGMVKQTL